jgi:hypothetical protein
LQGWGLLGPAAKNGLDDLPNMGLHDFPCPGPAAEEIPPVWSYRHARVYEQLLPSCGRLTFPAPWDFLRPPAGVYGPVVDPAATLAALRRTTPDSTLAAADTGPGWLDRMPRAVTTPVR